MNVNLTKLVHMKPLIHFLKVESRQRNICISNDVLLFAKKVSVAERENLPETTFWFLSCNVFPIHIWERFSVAKSQTLPLILHWFYTHFFGRIHFRAVVRFSNLKGLIVCNRLCISLSLVHFQKNWLLKAGN